MTRLISPKETGRINYRHQRHQPADGPAIITRIPIIIVTDRHNSGQVLSQRVADGIDIIGNQTQGFAVGFCIEVFEAASF